MTAQAETGALAPVEQRVTVTIDGFEITVPKGMLVIRAAELLGIQIPRFCDHPLLDPVGACRQCLVEVEDLPDEYTVWLFGSRRQIGALMRELAPRG